MAISISQRRDYPDIAGVLALDMAVHAVMGAAAATMISLTPLVGVTFGAAYFVGSHATHFFEQWMDNRGCSPFNNHTTLTKVMKFAIAFLAGIALASTSCTFIGTPLVFSTGLSLTAAMLTTSMTIATFVRCHAQAKEVVIGPSLLSALRC